MEPSPPDWRPGESISVRDAADSDRDGVWAVLEPVIRAGETFAFDPATRRDDALASWFGPKARVFVAERVGRVVGTAWVRPNQPGLGSHVANASFAVAPAARGLGVGRALALQALLEAERLGYRAMQFNLVVATNQAAIELWRSLGFDEVGRLPEAFRLRGERYVDALVMRRDLGPRS